MYPDRSRRVRQHRDRRRPAERGGLTGCSSGGAAAAPAPAPSAAAPAAPAQGPKPTVVLVHGAFADASSWAGVVTRLQKQGYPVVAPALAMRGLAADSAYLASLLSQIKGPVVLAGHPTAAR